MTDIINCDRYELLEKLPKNGTVGEIGVYRGEFSEQIVERSKPEKLILIDPWKTMLNATETNSNFENFYTEVKEKFSMISSVDIIRETSIEAAKSLQDNSLDWLYIDGDHNYQPCLDDLRTYAPKVKEHGYICGHDWVTRPKKGFGVNEAVQEFVTETGFILIGITNEINFKSYVIAKTRQAVETFNEQ